MLARKGGKSLFLSLSSRDLILSSVMVKAFEALISLFLCVVRFLSNQGATDVQFSVSVKEEVFRQI